VTENEQTGGTGRPSVCRNCGAIIGAGERDCAVCGAAARPQPPPMSVGRRPIADPETLRFIRAIIVRRAPFTIIFLVANIFLFVLMLISTRAQLFGSFDYVTLAAYGAKINAFIRDNHEWWRFITPMFLHANLLHILTNMYGLFILGPYVEKLYGSSKFVVFWVLTGIGGIAASYFAVQPQLAHGFWGRFLFRTTEYEPSVGASSALFGLVGVLFVFGIKYRKELPEDFKRAFGTGMIPTIAINLFIGFTIPFIDNAAHLGGFLAGAFLALLFDYQRPYARPAFRFVWRVLAAASLALVVISFAAVARHFDTSVKEAQANAPKVEDATTTDNLTASYAKAIVQGQQAFVKFINAGDPSDLAPAIETLERTPALDAPSSKVRADLIDLLKRAQTLNSAKTEDKANPKARRAERDKLLADYQKWDEGLLTLIKTNGAKYGIEVREEKNEK
jgi:rhomboid protease GluP